MINLGLFGTSDEAVCIWKVITFAYFYLISKAALNCDSGIEIF
jgi:hypothetical protein